MTKELTRRNYEKGKKGYIGYSKELPQKGKPFCLTTFEKDGEGNIMVYNAFTTPVETIKTLTSRIVVVGTQNSIYVTCIDIEKSTTTKEKVFLGYVRRIVREKVELDKILVQEYQGKINFFAIPMNTKIEKLCRISNVYICNRKNTYFILSV